eukprot:GHRR01012507.1.p2 GENE.GHRR01012507.1~~GHRR01012507.1.p2  ORF type:complete len:134 (-),score=45.16 GHRR01012507.1:1659-2060(-)
MMCELPAPHPCTGQHVTIQHQQPSEGRSQNIPRQSSCGMSRHCCSMQLHEALLRTCSNRCKYCQVDTPWQRQQQQLPYSQAYQLLALGGLSNCGLLMLDACKSADADSKASAVVLPHCRHRCCFAIAAACLSH